MIKIAIVEDNEALRKSLENLFNNTEGMKCVLSLNNLLNVVSELGKASAGYHTDGYRTAAYIRN